MLIFGDLTGITQLLDEIPVNIICGIVVASLRPQYIRQMKQLSKNNKLKYLSNLDINHKIKKNNII